jgi:hypothetical protein
MSKFFKALGYLFRYPWGFIRVWRENYRKMKGANGQR